MLEWVPSSAATAADTSYDNTESGLDADTVQDAIDELAAGGRVWLPLTTVVGGVPELVWDADDSLIPTEAPT